MKRIIAKSILTFSALVFVMTAATWVRQNEHGVSMRRLEIDGAPVAEVRVQPSSARLGFRLGVFLPAEWQPHWVGSNEVMVSPHSLFM